MGHMSKYMDTELHLVHATPEPTIAQLAIDLQRISYEIKNVQGLEYQAALQAYDNK